MKHHCCWLILCVISFAARAQDALVPMDFYTTLKAERMMQDSTQRIHPEIKPYSTFTVRKFTSTESDLLRERANEKVGSSNRFRINPLLNASPFYATGKDARGGYYSYVGVSAGWRIFSRFVASADVISGLDEPANYMRQINDSLHVASGIGRGFGNGRHISFQQSTFTLGWNASKHVQLFAGRGKNFIGEGYRSLLLSDFATNYNYMRTDVNVWRIKYVILFNQMKQPQGYPLQAGPLLNKYSTAHYLSLNITKWWSVGAFETIIWESEDSVQHRQFDVNYLNPIIFFRPVEYSIGSSDNALLGFSTTFRPARGLTIYATACLDEFLMKEVLAPFFKKYTDSTTATGYWANKQAYQVGVKYHEPFKMKNTSVLAEFNAVRPFTYGHGNVNQSYTNMNQPLAHPLGANFIEWVGMAVWQPGKWNVGWRNTYARKGFSNEIGFMGEDILVSNSERGVRGGSNGEYGHFMLQGRKTDVLNSRLEVGYLLMPAWNLRMEAGIHLRTQRTHQHSQSNVFYTIGLKSALWNDYRDI